MEFSISGPGILLRISTGIPFLGDILITETLAVSWLVMLLVTGACIWMTRGLQVENISKKQVLAEFLVEQARRLVADHGGSRYERLIPFVAALTKADKLKKSQLASCQVEFERLCAPYGCQGVFLTSAENGYGMDALRACLEAHLDGGSCDGVQ